MSPTPLSWYEQQQVEKIAAWKAEPPAYLSAILQKVTHPLVNVTEQLVRPETVVESIRDAYASSEISVHRERVLKRVGVAEVRELRERELKFCNELADMLALEASQGAMFWGAAAGGGNLLAALTSVRALMGYCLKTIHTIGYCYGFGTEEPHERDFVLGVLLIAAASTLEEKQHAIGTIGQVEDMIFEEAFEDLLQEAIGEQILETAGLMGIPMAGILTGAMHSASTIEHTAAVAKYCFVERWLRSRRRIDRIQPDPEHARSFIRRARARTANSVYWGSFGAGFVLSVPFAWLFRRVPTDNAVLEGIKNGRLDGQESARRAAARLTGSAAPDSRAQTILDAAVV
jgi:hypothetical protein